MAAKNNSVYRTFLSFASVFCARFFITYGANYLSTIKGFLKPTLSTVAVVHPFSKSIKTVYSIKLNLQPDPSVVIGVVANPV